MTSSLMVKVVTPNLPLLVVNTERYGAGSLLLSIQDAQADYTYAWYDASGSQKLGDGPTYTTPTLTQSTSYQVTATGCDVTTRIIPVTIRQVRITVNGSVPTAATPLSSSTIPYALTLQAETSPANAGPYTWYLDGAVINGAISSQLNATQAGRYTVMLPGTGPEYISLPVDVLGAFDGQSVNGQALSYTTDIKVLKAGVTTLEQVRQLAVADRVQTVTYSGGFGQALQQVVLQAGPAQEDIIQPFSYIGSPTTAQSFLPFPLPASQKAPGMYDYSALADVGTYYQAKGGQPYATATAEASPLTRPISQAQSGTAWASHPATITYQLNEASEVRRWQGADGSQWYGAEQLSKQVLLDPDQRQTIVFKDALGRVVLERKVAVLNGTSQSFDTYSVYDALGRLQLTIPPAAVVELAAGGNWNIDNLAPATPSFRRRWLYQYTYDEKGRLVERQFPGADPVYLVYDKFDRAILVQDGNHRKAGVNQWVFTKYDAQNRPVVSGLYYYNNQSATARQDLQSQVDGSSLTAEFESRSSTGYTTGNTFPAVQDGQSGAVILSMTFFDDYDLNQDGSPDYTYTTQALGTNPQPVATTQLRGLTTVTRTRVVQPGGQYGVWLTAALFYDEYGNLIQKQSNNLLQTGSSLADVTTLVYRQQGFVPQVLASLKTQQTSGIPGNFSPVVSIRNRFTYDAAGRVLQTWQQHQWKNSWEPEVLVSNNTYTGLGELTTKQLHSRNEVNYLQKVDFAYNLHGQLARINQSTVSTSPLANFENDLFGLQIYREQAGDMGGTPRYDGGISAVSWMAHNTAQTNQPERERSYRFTYDELGRMTAALYVARSSSSGGFGGGFGTVGGTWTVEQGAYDERGISYDANGNITALQRYSQANASASPIKIDDLTFTYTNAGNQHSKVDDAGDITRGFKDATGSSSEYDYDPNGSITRDANKNITYTYNALNKVEQQTVGSSSLVYTYDAAGTLLCRKLTTNAIPTKTDYYVDGIVYEQLPGFGSYAGLLSVPTSEGRALVGNRSDTRLTYEYHLRDHLGNLRVAFRAQAGTDALRLSSENPGQEEGAYPRFQNVTSTQNSNAGAYHGSYVAAVTRSQAGPTIAIPVADRDHLKVRVYYKTPAGVQTYAQPTPPSGMTTASAVGLAVAPTFLPTTRSVDGRPTQAAGVQLSITGLLSRLLEPRQTAARPQQAAAPLGNFDAYLRWTLLNSKGQPISTGTQTAPVSASSQSSWTKLDLPLDVDLSSDDARTGTLRIEEVNDGSQVVYFDSLTITHPLDKALVTQENHYYPFGMALSGVAVNTVPVADLSKEQFNEGSTLEDELLGTEGGVYSTDFRTYDPATGRFTGVDPLADATPSLSPYHFANNDPVNYNDPSGALFEGLGSLLSSVFSDIWNWASTVFFTDGLGAGATTPVAWNDGNGTVTDRPLYPNGMGGSPQGGGRVSGTGYGAYDGFNSFTNGGSGSNISTYQIGTNGSTSLPVNQEPNQGPGNPKSVGNTTITTHALTVPLPAIPWSWGWGGMGGAVTAEQILAAVAPWVVFLSIPGDHAIRQEEDFSGQRLALGVEDQLIEFSRHPEINAIPYYGRWAPSNVTWRELQPILLRLGQLPGTTFHFNLSSDKGRIDSPGNLRFYGDGRSRTLEEARFLFKYFPGKTTFYQKSGSLFKKTVFKGGI